MTWALVLVLYIGTPNQTETQLAERLSWQECVGRALSQLPVYRERYGDVFGLRCEPFITRAGL